MEKFTFRIIRKFDNKRKYDEILAVIGRIKARCQKHKIRETFFGHPANAFDSMSLPADETEECLHDNFLLFFDSADNLMQLNESISGVYGWDKIADVIDTHTGVGVNDWHWELKTYRLKTKYAQLLIDNLNELEKEIRANYEAFLVNEREKEAKIEAIKKSIASINTSERAITDEGGRTKMYTHTITFHDGEKLTFTERNVFDFGIVINPSYSVVPGAMPGGLCVNCDGCYQWHKFNNNEGWAPVRKLTKNETTALNYLEVFGKFARHSIRM